MHPLGYCVYLLNFSLSSQTQHLKINMQLRVISLCGSASLNNSLSSVAVGINYPDTADQSGRLFYRVSTYNQVKGGWLRIK